MQIREVGSANKRGRVAVIKRQDQSPPVNLESGKYSGTTVTTTRFFQFWDLMRTIRVHGYLRAAMGVIGRSAVGTWWRLSKHPEFKSSARELHRKRLWNFYMFTDREWDNIKDFYSMAYKIMIAVMYLRYFGFAAFNIVRNKNGDPIGLDFMHGYVVPNVDSQGYFKNGAAFVQYPDGNNISYKIEYSDPRDVVYISNPDWEGFVTGSGDIEALTDFTLPLDIYLQTAAREYIQNRNTPEAIFVLGKDLSDDAFDDFVDAIQTWYSGPKNIGHNPVAVQGELDVKILGKIPSDLPYQESRKDTRTETLAVSGVSGGKLGISEDMTNSNLRELRREFHETSLVPLFKFVEIAFYEQIHVREFGMEGWEFIFNSPDFLTAVERATVDMRLYGISVINPNEIRGKYGLERRKGELGDLFSDELSVLLKEGPEVEPEEPQGSPPEGREEDPEAPAQIGEPTDDDQDPPRGDDHDEEVRDILRELSQFKRFAVNRFKDGRGMRQFNSAVIPVEILNPLNHKIMGAGSLEEIVGIFDYVEGALV